MSKGCEYAEDVALQGEKVDVMESALCKQGVYGYGMITIAYLLTEWKTGSFRSLCYLADVTWELAGCSDARRHIRIPPQLTLQSHHSKKLMAESKLYWLRPLGRPAFLLFSSSCRPF